IAVDRGDLNEAARHWDTARRRHPYFPQAYMAGAEVERRAGRADKADEFLASGGRMIKGGLDLHLQYGRSAHSRCEWGAAIERWALVRERFPDCDEARERSAEALVALAQQGAPAPRVDAPVGKDGAQSLMRGC